MADLKISALTAATTPLAGTEVVPLVQSGTTKKVAVSDLTAGRAVSAASLALTSSPLPTTSGGTALTSFTANGVVYASNTSALATDSALTFNGAKLSITGATGASYLVLNAPTDGGYASLQVGGATFADFGSFKGINGTGSATDFYLGARGTNNLLFGTAFAEGFRLTSTNELLVGLTSATGVAKLQVSGAIKTTGFTVATLPTGTVGMRTYVTDALAPSFSAAVVGGGAVTIPVFYNGSSWIVA